MLDLKIVFIINTFVLFFLSIYMFIKYKQNPYNRTIKFLTYFANCYFIGFLLVISRNKISDFISIVIANTLFISGTISLYIAIRALLNLDSQVHIRYIIPILIIFVGFFIFTYIDYNIEARLILFSSSCIFFASIYSWLFWFYSSEKFTLFDRVSCFLFIIEVMLFTTRILNSFSINIQAYLFRNESIFSYLPNLFMLTLNIWIVILVKYRIPKT